MYSNFFSLNQNVGVVTGGTRGLGKEIATALASAGASLALTYLEENLTQAQQVEKELLDTYNVKVKIYPLDLKNRTAINQIMECIESDFGRLDILINNAAIRQHKVTIEVSEEEWDEVMSVNLKGAFFCAQEAAKIMVKHKTGGKIINIASQLGHVVAKNRVAYCVSKAGLVHLTKALAVDFAPHNIRVNAISPGVTNTVETGALVTFDQAAEFLAKMPIGRRVEPKEVASAAIYLASNEANAVTGHTLLVDGGWTVW